MIRLYTLILCLLLGVTVAILVYGIVSTHTLHNCLKAAQTMREVMDC